MVMLLILAAQAAHLPTRMNTVLTVIRVALQAVTTPSNRADFLETKPTIPVLTVAVCQ